MKRVVKPSIWRVNRGQRLSRRLAFYSVFPGASTVWNAVDGQSTSAAEIFTPTPYGRGVIASTEASAPSFPLGYMPIRGSNGDGSGDFTLLLVANPDTAAASALFSQRADASPDFTQISLISNFNVAQITTTGAICLFLDDQSSGSAVDFGATSDTTAIDGNWHVYVIGCQNGTYFIYVDGKLNVASQTAPGLHKFVPSVTPQTLRIGGFGGTTGFLANCGIAVSAAWNRALSLEEVQAITRDPWLPLRPQFGITAPRRLFAATQTVSDVSVSQSGAVATTASATPAVGITGRPIGASATTAAQPLTLAVPSAVATTAARTLTTTISAPISGAAVATVAASLSLAVPGAAATTAAAVPTAAISKASTGAAATTSAGTLGRNVSARVTGAPAATTGSAVTTTATVQTVVGTTRRTAEFIGSLGMNMHLMDYGSVSNTITQMNYLGISNYRDTVWAGDPASVAAYTTMGHAGMKLLAINMGDPAGPKPEWDTLAPYLFGIEGPNEVNITSPSYQGLTGDAAAIAIQKAMYPMIRGDSTLNGVPVLTFSVAQPGGYAQYGDLTGYCDYVNVHSYGGQGVPPFYYLMPITNGASIMAPTKPAIITETGSFTMLDGDSGVNEDVQARWNVAAFLDDFMTGVVATFIYQLHDVSDPGNTTNQFHFGVYHADDTPKLSGIAIHNLTTILNDAGATAKTFSPGTMAYSIQGVDPYNNFTMALAKSSGAYDICLWAEPVIWASATNTETLPGPSTATVNLGKVWPSVNVYKVLSGTAPVATYTNVSSVSVSYTAEAVIIEVSGTTAVVPPVAGGQTLFSASDVPFDINTNDALALELGVKFIPSVNGQITAIRFYKGQFNSGVHTGSLWTSGGTNLGTVTFASETQSGWQQQAFSSPIPVTAGQTYVASYHTPVGYYSSDTGYFNASHISGSLTAPSTSGVAGGNGVYIGSSSPTFPTNTYQGSNYWVDAVFTTVGTNVTPTGVAAATAAAGTVSLQAGLLAYGASATTAARPLRPVVLAATAATSAASPVTLLVTDSATGAIATTAAASGIPQNTSIASGVVATGLAAAITQPLGASTTSAAAAPSLAISDPATGTAAATAAGSLVENAQVAAVSTPATASASPLQQLIVTGAVTTSAAAAPSVQETLPPSGALATGSAASLVTIRSQGAAAATAGGSVIAIPSAIPAASAGTSAANITSQLVSRAAPGATASGAAGTISASIADAAISAAANTSAGAIIGKAAASGTGTAATTTAALIASGRPSGTAATGVAATVPPLEAKTAPGTAATTAPGTLIATPDALVAMTGSAATSAAGGLPQAISKATPGIAATGLASPLTVLTGVVASVAGSAATGTAGALGPSVTKASSGASGTATASVAAALTTATAHPSGTAAASLAATLGASTTATVTLAGALSSTAATALVPDLRATGILTGAAGSAVIGSVITPVSPAGASAISLANSVNLADTLNATGTLATTLASVLSGNITLVAPGIGGSASAASLGISSGFRVPNAVAMAAANALNTSASTNSAVLGSQANAIPANLAIFTLTPAESLLRANIATLPPDLRALTIPLDM